MATCKNIDYRNLNLKICKILKISRLKKFISPLIDVWAKNLPKNDQIGGSLSI